MYTESIDRCVCQVRTDNIYLIDFSHLFSGDKEQICYPFYMFPWQPQAFCSSKIFYIFKTKWNTNVMVFVVEGVIPRWIFVNFFIIFEEQMALSCHGNRLMWHYPKDINLLPNKFLCHIGTVKIFKTKTVVLSKIFITRLISMLVGYE